MSATWTALLSSYHLLDQKVKRILGNFFGFRENRENQRLHCKLLQTDNGDNLNLTQNLGRQAEHIIWYSLILHFIWATLLKISKHSSWKKTVQKSQPTTIFDSCRLFYIYINIALYDFYHIWKTFICTYRNVKIS